MKEIAIGTICIAKNHVPLRSIVYRYFSFLERKRGDLGGGMGEQGELGRGVGECVGLMIYGTEADR